MLKPRRNPHLLDKSLTDLLETCDQYSKAAKNYYRQVFLNSDQLLRGTAVARLEIAMNNLKNSHYSMIEQHTTADIFNLLPECHRINSIKTLNFSVAPGKLSKMMSKDGSIFDKFELQTSRDKEVMEDFETNSGFMAKLDEFEKVNIGHIYCGETIRKKSMLLSGKFGTALVNHYDGVISKVNHGETKIYSCRFWRSLQMYFPGDDDVFIWKDDYLALSFNHKFKGGNPKELINYSKCVQSIDSKVYFLSHPSNIIEVDWHDIATSIQRGLVKYQGKLVLYSPHIKDFHIYEDTLYVLFEQGDVGKLRMDGRSEMARHVEVLLGQMDFTAIVSANSRVIVAAHQSSRQHNLVLVYSDALQQEQQVQIAKSEACNSPIRSFSLIERSDATYIIGLCAADQVLLFQLTSSKLNILEVLNMNSSEERVLLNGIHLDRLKSKFLVFGDFNFQQMVRLRV